jgi:hypothetical protein
VSGAVKSIRAQPGEEGEEGTAARGHTLPLRGLGRQGAGMDEVT